MDIKSISDKLSLSEQLQLSDVSSVAEQGYRSIICNRPDGEIKGSVMGWLKQSQYLTANVFLSQYDAIRTLAPMICKSDNAQRQVK